MIMQGLYSTINMGMNPLCLSSSMGKYKGAVVFYEHKSEGLVSRKQFLFRLLRHFFLAFAFIIITLLVVVVGYLIWCCGGNLLYAILNSAFSMSCFGIYDVSGATDC